MNECIGTSEADIQRFVAAKQDAVNRQNAVYGPAPGTVTSTARAQSPQPPTTSPKPPGGGLSQEQIDQLRAGGKF